MVILADISGRLVIEGFLVGGKQGEGDDIIGFFIGGAAEDDDLVGDEAVIENLEHGLGLLPTLTAAGASALVPMPIAPSSAASKVLTILTANPSQRNCNMCYRQ